jgi:lipopolysaccharide/colanic/teichoic acid biosynthesis glycosyltransferase
VVLEAQASERPVVTTNATGAVDSVIDGKTGFIVPVRDAENLAKALLQIANLPDRGREMGRAGRALAERSFDQKKVWKNLFAYYTSIARGTSRQRGMGQLFKWTFDRLFALVVLVALAPVLVAVGLFVWWTMGWPIVFRQARIGRRGRPIYIHKFRTMTDERDAKGELLPDAQRLGRVGRMLRALSIDELPQLWDVLRGVISFVGPRPLLERYRERYDAEQWRRHNVHPGITGWAQINGRNAINWEQKFELDVWYVDHWSFWLDLKILWLTVWRTLRRDGISYGAEATMPEFMPSTKTKSAHE